MRGDSRSIVERVEEAVDTSLNAANVYEAERAVVVAVSGGADSLCLLHALHRIWKGRGALHVAHLDHMLRGDASCEDARFVAAQAALLGLPCTVGSRDVSAYRARLRCSLEEAAREARYSFLATVARELGAVCVLTGHTRDDAVETVLLHILRGTGVHGLRGLESVSPFPSGLDGEWSGGSLRLVRPLLEVSRADAREYCGSLGLEPREDASNASLAYQRNRVRLKLLPEMRQVNPRVDDALLRLASSAAQDDDHIAETARGIFEGIAQCNRDQVRIKLPGFLGASAAVQARLIVLTLTHLTGGARDVSAEHIQAVRDVAAGSVGRQVDLPSGISWRRGYTELTALRRGSMDAVQAQVLAPVVLPVPGEVELPTGRLTAHVVTVDECDDRGPDVACMDAERVGSSLIVRKRLPGDRFQPLGMCGEKKLQDFMVDAHIDVRDRDHIPIVCSHQHIVWIAGWRVDDRVRITPDTRRVLRLQYVRRG